MAGWPSAADAVRRVFRTGFSGSAWVDLAGPLGRIPAPGLRVVREGPLGCVDAGGEVLCERTGGPRLCVGGPRLEPPAGARDGGPRESEEGGPPCGDANERVGVDEEVEAAPNGLQSSSSSSS